MMRGETAPFGNARIEDDYDLDADHLHAHQPLHHYNRQDTTTCTTPLAQDTHQRHASITTNTIPVDSAVIVSITRNSSIPNDLDNICDHDEYLPNNSNVSTFSQRSDEAGTTTALSEVSRSSTAIVITSSSKPRGNLYWWYIKVICSSILLVFCIIMAVASNVEDQVEAEDRYGIQGALLVLSVTLLFMLTAAFEGGMVCLVGLTPIDPNLYRETHPIAYKCTSLAHRGNNMARYVAGKQLMIIFLVFVIDFCTEPISDAHVLNQNMADWICTIFLQWRVALTVITVLLADVVPQLLGAECMLDFLNSHVILVTIYVALGLEWSGLLHAAYLVPMAIKWCYGVDYDDNKEEEEEEEVVDDGDGDGDEMEQGAENKNKRCHDIVFWVKAICSLFLFAFALVLIAIHMFRGHTEVTNTVYDSLTFFLFLFIILWAALVQGMQIALFALKNTSIRDLRPTHKIAYLNFKAAFGTGNIEPFLIGRQIFVTAAYFYLSSVTRVLTDDDDEDAHKGEADDDDLIFEAHSIGVREFILSNALGALVTAIPLLWGRLTASAIPRKFLSNIFILPNIYLCRAIGSLGIVDASWPIVAMLKSCYLGWYRSDLEYLPHLGDNNNNQNQHGSSVATISGHSMSGDYLVEGYMRVPLIVSNQHGNNNSDAPNDDNNRESWQSNVSSPF